MADIQIQLTLSNTSRLPLLRRALVLQCITVGWNLLEGLLAVLAGISAGSVALLGFGVDSFVEIASGTIVGWRLWQEQSGDLVAEKLDDLELKTARIAGALLLFLSGYVLFDSIKRLIGFGEHSRESLAGLAVTILALVVMPPLASAKLKIADKIGSKSLRADAMESVCCAWLAGSTLVGLLLNAVFHWWWADPLAGLIIVPLLAKEGLENLRGAECNCHGNCDANPASTPVSLSPTPVSLSPSREAQSSPSREIQVSPPRD